MIGIADYGLGNIEAFANIFRRLRIDARRVSEPRDVARASKLILPGVGAFDWAMERLNASGLRAPLDEAVLARGVPVLGVCVGLQMMMDRSEEGGAPGLGWIGGDVVRLPVSDLRLPLPHMGWNHIIARDAEPLFRDMVSPRFYFLHSYCVVPRARDASIAEADYGRPFSCAVRRDRIMGVQFHPEKSHHWGMRLLENFATLSGD